MEKLDKALEVSQVTGRQEPLGTWQKETRICETCGAEFWARYPLNDSSKVMKICRACADKVQDERRQEEALEKLKEAREWQREVWRDTCGVPGLFYAKTFDDFDGKLQPKAFKILKEYSYEYDDATERPAISIVLLSPNLYGVGKTHLVCALANKIMEIEEPARLTRQLYVQKKRCPVHFTTEAKLLSRIRETYNKKDGETEEEIYAALQSHQVLIIDDVGKVRPRDYSFLQGVHFRVIDDRYVNEVPIIITTNLDYAELEAHIGGASSDRLREMCSKEGFIVLKGQSYRRQ